MGTFIPKAHLPIRPQNEMHFKLETETITTINDGGINITEVIRGGRQEWVYRSKRTLPVLSFEVMFNFCFLIV